MLGFIKRGMEYSTWKAIDILIYIMRTTFRTIVSGSGCYTLTHFLSTYIYTHTHTHTHTHTYYLPITVLDTYDNSAEKSRPALTEFTI